MPLRAYGWGLCFVPESVCGGKDGSVTRGAPCLLQILISLAASSHTRTFCSVSEDADLEKGNSHPKEHHRNASLLADSPREMNQWKEKETLGKELVAWRDGGLELGCIHSYAGWPFFGMAR